MRLQRKFFACVCAIFASWTPSEARQIKSLQLDDTISFGFINGVSHFLDGRRYEILGYAAGYDSNYLYILLQVEHQNAGGTKSYAQTIVQYDLVTRRELSTAELNVNGRRYTCRRNFAVSRLSDRAVVACDTVNILVELPGGKEIFRIDSRANHLVSIFSGSGNHLIHYNYNGGIQIFSSHGDGRPIHSSPTPVRAPTSSDGYIASNNQGTALCFLDGLRPSLRCINPTTSVQLQEVFTDIPGSFQKIFYSPKKDYFVALFEKRYVVLDGRDAYKITSFDRPLQASISALSDDGNMLAINTFNSFRIYDVESGNSIYSGNPLQSPWPISFALKDTRIIVPEYNNTARRLDIKSYKITYRE